MSRSLAAALCALVVVVFASSAFGAEAIFPVPLHLTREVHDPVSGKTVVLNEYGYGNRLVSVRGDVTAIADYEKGELTEIDRRAGTYSVTRFETIARAIRLQGGPGGGGIERADDQQMLRTEERPAQALQSLGAKATKSGRPAEFFRAEVDSQSVEVAVDRSVRMSEQALEVLLGTAYPGTRGRHQELVMSAARGPQGSAMYALPLEQTFEIRTGEDRVQFRSSVLRVGDEPPPADAVAIPAGARLVVSRTAAVLEELEHLDSAPLVPPTKKP